MLDDLLTQLNKRNSIQERLATLRETKSWEQIALALYGILDDIDTEDDRCKSNNEAFRRFVMQHQARKNQYLYSPDGHNVVRVNEGLSDYARRELELAGMFDEDSDYDGAIGEAVMGLIDVFAAQGHSGFSAGITQSIFNQLASYKPLSELTNDPDEWCEIAEDVVDGKKFKMYQSKRSPVCFSRDGGKTYWNIDEMECRIPGKEPMHTSVDRKVSHA